MAVAHVAEVSYHLFDPKAGELSDYWNAYYYLYAIGPHLSGLLTITGVYLLIPSTRKVKLFVIVPITYKLAKIIWLSCVTSNPELHRFVPWSFVVLGFTAGLVWILVFEWLMNLHYHKREGAIARIVGIMTAPGIDPVDKERIAQREIEYLRSLK